MYTQMNQRLANVGSFGTQYQRGAEVPWLDTTNAIAVIVARVGDPFFSLQTSEENRTHWVGALNGTMPLFSWLTATGTVGLDLFGTINHLILPAGLIPNNGGVAQDDRRNIVGRTGTFGLQALTHPGRLSFQSSVGVQYIYAHTDGLSGHAENLAPGSTSIGTGTYQSIRPLWSETVNLGTYGEEILGLNDRLFLTGSLRYDGSSSFGDKYHPRPYPKVGLSWIASEEPLLATLPGVHELRFRASYGAASRYPTSEMKLGSIAGFATGVEGSNQNIFSREELANPLLRPEHTQETEYGADATVLSNVNVRLTWHSRKTIDQLQPFQYVKGLPLSWANVGTVRAHGFEATVDVPIVSTPTTRADVSFGFSSRTDRVESLGGSPEDKGPYGNSFALGYPMDALFGQPILSVDDTVGGHADGIVFREEITRDTAYHFLGVLNPPRTFTAAPTVSLLNGWLRISALFDRQTGFLRYDNTSEGCPSTALCVAPFVTGTPLMLQAKYADSRREDWLLPGDFTRWQEFNVAVSVPPRFLQWNALHLRFSQATVSVLGRNLKLWTPYKSTDPASISGPFQGFLSGEANGIPQTRTWGFRFDITP